MSSIDREFCPLSSSAWRATGLSYHSLNCFYRQQFGTKVWKLSVDAGCSCPNRDGTLATLGCIFCDPESFSPSRRLPPPHGERGRVRQALCLDQTAQRSGGHSIAAQLDAAIARRGRQHANERFVAYFQPGSNTYGPTDSLRAAYLEAIARPEVVGLAIGTRPDCASDEILDVLAEIAGKTWLIVEFGVQTVHDRTLDRIARGHHYDAFVDAYRRCRQRGLNVGVHVILGLPGESCEDMLETAQTLANLELHSVKPHNLYAVKNTVLADQVAAGQVRLPELAEYVGWLVDFLERLPGRFVIERLCGDAPRDYLVGPVWCLNKAGVRRAVDAEFHRRGTWQGCKAAGSLADASQTPRRTVE